MPLHSGPSNAPRVQRLPASSPSRCPVAVPQAKGAAAKWSNATSSFAGYDDRSPGKLKPVVRAEHRHRGNASGSTMAAALLLASASRSKIRTQARARVLASPPRSSAADHGLGPCSGAEAREPAGYEGVRLRCGRTHEPSPPKLWRACGRLVLPTTRSIQQQRRRHRAGTSIGNVRRAHRRGGVQELLRRSAATTGHDVRRSRTRRGACIRTGLVELGPAWIVVLDHDGVAVLALDHPPVNSLGTSCAWPGCRVARANADPPYARCC